MNKLLIFILLCVIILCSGCSDVSEPFDLSGTLSYLSEEDQYVIEVEVRGRQFDAQQLSVFQLLDVNQISDTFNDIDDEYMVEVSSISDIRLEDGYVDARYQIVVQHIEYEYLKCILEEFQLIIEYGTDKVSQSVSYNLSELIDME